MSPKPRLYLVLATAGDLESYDRQGFLDRFKRQVDYYSDRFDVTVISPDRKDYSSRIGVRHRTSPMMSAKPVLRHMLYMIFLVSISIGMRRGVIRVFNVSNPAIPFMRALSGNPVVASYHYDWVDQARVHHNALKWLSAWVIERFVFTSLDFVIPMSGRLKKKLRRHGFRMEVIPNFVDSAVFHASGSKKRQIIFMGRMERYKGIDVLLKAASGLDRKLLVLLAGDGPDRSRLESLSRDLGVNARFLGYLDQKALAKHVRESYALALPTTTMEGNPKVIIEAFASGTPCIVTDIRGSREIVTDSVNGLIVRPGDDKGMRMAIGRIVSDRALRSRLSVNALKESRKYSIERLLGREAAILKEVLDGHGA